MTLTERTRTRLPRPTARPTTWALLGLLGVTAAWGSTFFMLKGVLDRVPAADFLAVRFALATAVLLAIAPRAVARLSPTARRQAVAMGLVYGAGQLLQTVGLETTSASVSGFVTGMYVVFTPLLAALLLGTRLPATAWWAVGLATVGLGVLSLQGFAIGTGELLTLLGALCYAGHIVGMSHWSRSGDILGMAVVQLATVTVVCAVGAAPGGVAVSTTLPDLGVLVHMALVAGALALIVQSWAQSHLAPTRAAVVMTMEPVWAAGFAVAFGGEHLGPRVALGGMLVMAAMYLVEREQVAQDPPPGPEQDPARSGVPVQRRPAMEPA